MRTLPLVMSSTAQTVEDKWKFGPVVFSVVYTTFPNKALVLASRADLFNKTGWKISKSADARLWQFVPYCVLTYNKIYENVRIVIAIFFLLVSFLLLCFFPKKQNIGRRRLNTLQNLKTEIVFKATAPTTCFSSLILGDVKHKHVTTFLSE